VNDVTAAADPADAGRKAHYAEFYGCTAAEQGDIAVVVGNCQAESLRIMLHGAGLHTVRTPPVHELVASDIPHLHRLLDRAMLLVSQPVRDDYHDLPLGLGQLSARLTASGSTVVVPVIRFAGLYPAHAIIRPPSDLSLTPPIVAYHDLRTLAEAAGFTLSSAPLTAAAVRSIADDSLAELVRREEAYDTVRVSGQFTRASFELMRTLNHPGNVVFAAVARQVRHRVKLPEHEVDPGRSLLNSVHAPREAAVIDFWNIDSNPSTDWVVDGTVVAGETVREAHLAWYAEHPDAVSAGLQRHSRALDSLAAA
jgi:hypothetical protein